MTKINDALRTRIDGFFDLVPSKPSFNLRDVAKSAVEYAAETLGSIGLIVCTILGIEAL